MLIITTRMFGPCYIVIYCKNPHKIIIATHLDHHLFPSVSEPAAHTVFQHLGHLQIQQLNDTSRNPEIRKSGILALAFIMQ
jgi:hypothetical protein